MFTLLLFLCACARAAQPNDDDIVSVIRKMEKMVKDVEGVVDVERKELISVENDVGDNKKAVSNIKISLTKADNEINALKSGFAELEKKFKQEHKDWELQATNMCFGARDDSFGAFQLKKEGFLSGIKLVHRSGYVTCSSSNVNYRSNWGCNAAVWHGIGWLMVYITDELNNQVLPKYLGPIDPGYFLVGYHSKRKELILTDRPTRLYGYKGMNLRVWYSEDLRNESEEDNGGRSCADVYAMFE